MERTGSNIINEILDGGCMKVEQKFKTTEKLNVGHLSRPGYCFTPGEKAGDIYEAMKLNHVISEFTIVEDSIPIGFLTRTNLNEKLGGNYGFALYSKSPVKEIMETDFLSVDYSMSVDQVSTLAMQRDFERLYDPVVVKQDGKYLGIVTVKDILDTCTNMALTERDNIALMRDSLRIGLFFMDRDYTIQDQYSRYLEELFSQKNLCGVNFAGLLASSVTPNELNTIKEYFNMLIEHSFDQDTLDDINPLMELHYAGGDSSGKKVFQFGFAAIERNQGEVFLLVSVYDITAKVELQQRLEEEEARRQEEMKTIFELLQADPHVFRVFLEDTEYEFERINKILKDDSLSAHEALVNIYQSVHAIKSNAVTIGQNTFGGKVHNVESKIKKLREQEKEVSITEMLNLTIEINQLIDEKDKFKTTINKINSLKSSDGAGSDANNNIESKKQLQHVLVDALTKIADKVSSDMGKKTTLVVDAIDNEALEKGPRRIIKEVLVQLIRNSVVHGIELPEDRAAAGKNETGVLRLSIKAAGGKIHVRFGDDGRGLDYNKIAQKALRQNIIKPEDSKNKTALLNAIFSPGFSTAETEGLHAGRGIGLNLVKDRVREGNGYIKVQTKQGKGTVFNIYFPLS
jgi:two-component system chemotaxis sensor kinase CheA